jgi:hypothetical protein
MSAKRDTEALSLRLPTLLLANKSDGLEDPEMELHASLS